MATFAPGKASSRDNEAAPGDAGGGARRKPTRRLSAQERRAELLEAAVIEFAESGYHGTRTADIAARAGVSQPYVYALFPDKRALFLACHEWTTERIKEALEKASADATSSRAPEPLQGDQIDQADQQQERGGEQRAPGVGEVAQGADPVLPWQRDNAQT